MLTCRQCQPWAPTGPMEIEDAIDHLVDYHAIRAKVLIKKVETLLNNNEPNLAFRDQSLIHLVAEALGHRSEFPNVYGVYE